MDSDIEQLRINTYKASNDATKNLYGDVGLGEALGIISERFHFDAHTQRIFIDVIGDAILGLFPKENIEKQLIEQIHLPESSAVGIAKELGSFLDQINTQKTGGKPVTARNPSPQIQQNQLAGEPRPLTREELMQKLTPRRTMAGAVSALGHETTGTPAQGYEAHQNKTGRGGV